MRLSRHSIRARRQRKAYRRTLRALKRGTDTAIRKCLAGIGRTLARSFSATEARHAMLWQDSISGEYRGYAKALDPEDFRGYLNDCADRWHVGRYVYARECLRLADHRAATEAMHMRSMRDFCRETGRMGLHNNVMRRMAAKR